MKILLCGGGTLGPVTPLLAVVRSMKKIRNDLSFAWVGTSTGPEHAVVVREGIPFFSIPVAKLPRYFSLAWLTVPRDLLRALRAARKIFDDTDPDLIVGMGGFTQAPIMREARKRNIPCAIHQLDATPTLSNRFVAKLCGSATTSFEYVSPPFGSVASTRVATPCRFSGMTIPDREAAADRFFLDPSRPIAFVFGGGTGARVLNHAMDVVCERLPDAIQFILVTGEGRGTGRTSDRRTIVKERLDERDMLFAYAASDLVICRAGMGTLSELAALSKPAIVIPIPDSHQEQNAEQLTDGIKIVRQTDGFEKQLATALEALLNGQTECQRLGTTLHALLPTDDGTSVAERWLDLIQSSTSTTLQPRALSEARMRRVEGHD